MGAKAPAGFIFLYPRPEGRGNAEAGAIQKAGAILKEEAI